MTELSGIEHLILLDLLGAQDPVIRSSFIETAWLFDAMVSAERRLVDSGALTYEGDQATTKDHFKSFFVARNGHEPNFGGIGDDHVPFLRRGVSVLHVIANPFPRGWHKLEVCLFYFLALPSGC